MKYPLDFQSTFEDTMRFWIERYIRFKLTSLSNRQVKDEEQLAAILKSLTIGTKNIDELSKLVRSARNIGLIGVNTYYKPLEKLYRFLDNLGLASMKEIDEELIVDFLSSSTSGLSDATKKNYRIAMINFFAYIDKNNDDKHIYGIELKNWGGLRGKAGQKLPAYLSEEEIKRFLDAIDSYPFRTDVAARNRALIKLIIYTGIRVSEATHLKLKDLLPQEDVYLIKITGKGNKARVVMIKKEKIDHDLQEWLAMRQCEEGLLFCNKKGTPLTQAYISRIVEKILLSCGIRKEKNGAHMLRHTFATLLYNKSKDLVLVQEALGHASLDTSRIYTHFDKERLYKAASIMDKID
ncbi:tyrosine-type recombinase/integrase [Nitratiruptor sp. YY09-18]|uniref:tyrosine-type recombinase/integrase n=1 Tax=Nitratiruptor sp. YY09-18 TaxID=2724901 RepID=UPI001915FFE0|nr:tyrosine-type recombinase/integrase [Nitratiruptor sp. YY09-18]BCD68099.1 integrase/recombinase XerD [Nitratiruptor sp. YY09-18]